MFLCKTYRWELPSWLKGLETFVENQFTECISQLFLSLTKHLSKITKGRFMLAHSFCRFFRGFTWLCHFDPTVRKNHRGSTWLRYATYFTVTRKQRKGYDMSASLFGYLLMATFPSARLYLLTLSKSGDDLSICNAVFFVMCFRSLP